MVTPGWISLGPSGIGSVVVGGVVVEGGGGVVGVVSSADAIGTSSTKRATEQARTAAVASRRIGLSVARRLVGVGERIVRSRRVRRCAGRW